MSVFVSYSAKDKPFAEKLRAALEKRQIDTWSAETELVPGEDWANRIRSAIQDSDAVLAILSPDSLKSPWVNSELALALSDRMKGNQRPLIPILAKPVTDAPPFLRDIQWADMSTEDRFQANIERIIEVIQSRRPLSSMKDAQSARLDLLDAERRFLELEYKALAESRLRTYNLISTSLAFLSLVLGVASVVYTFVPIRIEPVVLIGAVSFLAGLTTGLMSNYVNRVFFSKKTRGLPEEQEASHARK
jgi:hypothetical protein